MSYKQLEVWQLAREISICVHRMTVELLPKFEMYEEGSQIRRAVKSVRSNIVEGYGRRRYKQDFLRFLTYAHASCEEAIDHLETLVETGSPKNDPVFSDLHNRLNRLGGKLNVFIKRVESQHLSLREDTADYSTEGE